MGEFEEGLSLGHRVEHRVALEAVANALLDILGKDAADGAINLGAAGEWVRDTHTNRWVSYATRGPLSYRAGINAATK
jgi:hypothetical protein